MAANSVNKQQKPWHQRGWLARNGYRYMKIDGKSVLVHRVLWESVHGPIPAGKCVIFRNGDKTDIRIRNLALSDPVGFPSNISQEARVSHGRKVREGLRKAGLFCAYLKDGELWKQCRKCQQHKPVATGFALLPRGTPHSRCITCRQEDHRSRYLARHPNARTNQHRDEESI